jgi:hypothetical protein
MKQLAITWAFIVIAVSVSVQAESLTASRTITENLVVHVPEAPCGVPMIAMRISELTAIPAGIEFIPSCSKTEPLRPRNVEEISFLGLTAEEALDRLMSMDPRYRWLETDGVIVVRPLEAWQDERHFMNATVSQFGFNDLNIAGALEMILAELRGVPMKVPIVEVPMRTEQGNLHFSVRPRTTSILEAANAVVRAHGSLRWTLSYCKPERRVDYALFMLGTFDHSGLGGTVKARTVVRDQNGRLRSDCNPFPVRPRSETAAPR